MVMKSAKRGEVRMGADPVPGTECNRGRDGETEPVKLGRIRTGTLRERELKTEMKETIYLLTFGIINYKYRKLQSSKSKG